MQPAVWTPERLALLRPPIGRRGGKARLRAINAPPGPPVPGIHAMYMRRLRLLRQADAPNEERGDAAQPGRDAHGCVAEVICTMSATAVTRPTPPPSAMAIRCT
jgi:hypothetical protein